MKRPWTWNGHILSAGDPQPGDQAPEGYIQWHAWAEVQHKAGLRQKECGKCGRWKYPQELSGEEVSCTGITPRGKKRTITMPVCNACLDDTEESALLRAKIAQEERT